MNTQPERDAGSAKPETRLGIVIRVCFFVAIVITGLVLVVGALQAVLGAVVAGTLGLFGTGLIANLLTMRIFDRRPLSDIGLQATRSSQINFATGLAMGGGAAALMLCAPLLAGTGHLVSRQDSSFSWGTLSFYLIALFAAALGEEMIFRGYPFQLLVEKMGSFATILPVSVIFGLLHASNPHASRLAVANTILWGVVLGCAFLRSHDLWLPIGLHFGWNAVLPLFGVSLSGLTIEIARYSYRWDLTPLWSGGEYGPEGGLLATIFAAALFAALWKAPIRPQWAYIAKSLNDSLSLEP